MTLQSSAFQHGDVLPKRFMHDSQNTTPPLAWRHEPARTRQIVIVLRRIEVGTQENVHWLLYNE
jgi:phosphatidylethanolamine-binding protein (PEBP) family uncharacterized protein